MRKKLTFTISIILILIASMILLLGKNFQPNDKKNISHPVSTLKKGQTYQARSNFYFKITKDNHFFALVNFANFSSEKDLTNYQKEQEDYQNYPKIVLTEGTYTFKNHEYRFHVQRSTTITFKNVHSIKQKQYAKIENKEFAYSNLKYWSLQRNGKHLQRQPGVKVTTSNRNIGNSIDDFLSRYTFKPKNLD